MPRSPRPDASDRFPSPEPNRALVLHGPYRPSETSPILGSSYRRSLQVGKAGFRLLRCLTLRTSNLWGSTVDVLISRVGDRRLPTFWMLNARVEKMFNFGSAGRLYLTIDGFNITNNDIELGWARFANNAATFKKITELVAPRIFRLGVRYEL